jgi:hypothetical protein
MQIEKQAALELVFKHVGARRIEQHLDVEPRDGARHVRWAA